MSSALLLLATRGTARLVTAFEAWGATDLYIRWTEAARGAFDAWPAWASVGVTLVGLALLFLGIRRLARPRAAE